MELGVDIASLMPWACATCPYAGQLRAALLQGRPLRPAALVVTNCATGNAHDSYRLPPIAGHGGWLRGAAATDLGNEDLVRSHVTRLARRDGPVDRAKLTDVVDTADPELRSCPNSAGDY
jgi:hypothetical protein